jgi:hypothetical protein
MVVVAAAVVVVTAAVVAVIATMIVSSANRAGKSFGAATPPRCPRFPFSTIRYFSPASVLEKVFF